MQHKFVTLFLFYVTILLEATNMSKIDKPLYERIGALLKEKREAKGYSLSQIGDMIGKSKVSVMRYEKGAQRIDYDTLSHLCKILGINIMDLPVPRLTAPRATKYEDIVLKAESNGRSVEEELSSMNPTSKIDFTEFVYGKPIYDSGNAVITGLPGDYPDMIALKKQTEESRINERLIKEILMDGFRASTKEVKLAVMALLKIDPKDADLIKYHFSDFWEPVDPNDRDE